MHLPKKYEDTRACIRSNQTFIERMIGGFDTREEDDKAVPPHLANARAWRAEGRAPAGDVEKVKYVLKNLARDWSQEGEVERAQSYGMVLEELQRVLPVPDAASEENGSPPSVLVPGTGLGRLVLETARLGYRCQGNEFSYYMLLVSSFILNQTSYEHEYVIHPWVHSSCNVIADMDQLRPVPIPDILPGECGIQPGLMSMCAGDFLEVYGDASQQEQWDCVITCYFLDTAHNIIEYMETIFGVLKKGGIWINLGPLLYHWADTAEDEMSVELCLKDVEVIASKMGFRFVQKRMVPSTYTADNRSMLQSMYLCAFWTMIKE